MTKSFPNTQLIISLLLFTWATYTFDFVSPYVFEPSPSHDHIIDVHFKKSFRFIDIEYVTAASKQYYKERYWAYYTLDFVFPFIYSAVLLYLASAIKKKYFRFFGGCVIIGAAFDLLENTCFYIFLYNNKSTYWAVLTSLLTTFKTILFVFNILFALTAFFEPRYFRPVHEWKRFFNIKKLRKKRKLQLQYL